MPEPRTLRKGCVHFWKNGRRAGTMRRNDRWLAVPTEPPMRRHRLFSYESKHEPVVPRAVFFRRLARNALAALFLIGVSLIGGMIGYHALEGMTWIDAFVNASMILAGMGPMGPLETWGGKL